MNTHSILRGRELLRVSLDRSGRERSIGEQHVDNLRDFAGSIVSWAEPYAEEGSASKYRNGRERQTFKRVLADLERGRFDADVLVLWEVSRLSRKTEEWAELCNACERHGKLIAVTTHGAKIYNPANGRDRRSLLEDAIDGEYESSKISLRVKRSTRASAEAGRPHGKIPFGYRRRYDPTTGRLSHQEADPVESALVVELYERVAAGHSIKGIARDWAERGITSRGSAKLPARPYSSQTLRSMLKTTTYIGLRTHRPKGRNSAPATVAGTWPPLISHELYQKVRHRLADPARKTSRPGRGVHLLSYIGRCDRCDGRLKVNYRPVDYLDGGELREYQCERGHVRLLADALDEHVVTVMLDWLSDPARYASAVSDDDGGVAAAALREEIAELERQLEDLSEQMKARTVRPDFGYPLAAEWGAQLDDARRRLDDLGTPVALRDLITPGDEVELGWLAAPMSTRREIARLLVGSDGLIGQLRVLYAPNRQRVDVADRVAFGP